MGNNKKQKNGFWSYFWFNVIVPNVTWNAIVAIPTAFVYLYGCYKTIQTYIATAEVPRSLVFLMIASLSVNFLILVLGIVYVIYRSRRKAYTPEFPKLESDYRIISAECEFYFRTRDKIEQRQYYEIEVLDDALEEILHNLQWTGQKYEKSKLGEGDNSATQRCNNDGITLIDTNRSSSPYPVKIKFNPVLRRGDIKSYSFTTFVSDTSKTMLPFVGKIIKCQTDRLVLRVTAPRGMIANPTFKISTDHLQDIPLDDPIPITAKVVGNNDTFEYVVNKAELLRFYSISWDFNV